MTDEPRYLNLDFLDQFTKGDADRLKKYLLMYLSTAPVVIGEFQGELLERNHESLRLKAHSIKPQAHYLGIEPLARVLHDIESSARQGDDTALGILVERAREISNAVNEEIQEFLGHAKRT